MGSNSKVRVALLSTASPPSAKFGMHVKHGTARPLSTDVPMAFNFGTSNVAATIRT